SLPKRRGELRRKASDPEEKTGLDATHTHVSHQVLFRSTPEANTPGTVFQPGYTLRYHQRDLRHRVARRTHRLPCQREGLWRPGKSRGRRLSECTFDNALQSLGEL